MASGKPGDGEEEDTIQDGPAALKEAYSGKGEEDVVPELVGQGPGGAQSSIDAGKDVLHEEEGAYEGAEGIESGEGHKVGRALFKIGGKCVGVRAPDEVPKCGEQEGRDENDPETGDAVEKVVEPRPLATLVGTQDGGADEIAAEGKEEADSSACEVVVDVEEVDKQPGAGLLVRKEEGETSVVTDDDQCRETAHGIEVVVPR